MNRRHAYCNKGAHKLTPGNRAADGRCKLCRRIYIQRYMRRWRVK